MRIAIIGCGAIGGSLARELTSSPAGLTLCAVFDRERGCAESLVNSLNIRIEIATTLTRVFELSELVIEAASASIVKEVLNLALIHDTDVLIMSTGGVLVSQSLIENIRRQGHPHVYLPSGALVGLDGLAAANLREIEHVTLTTSKPPQAFAEASYIQENNIDLYAINEPTVIFEGSARKAIEAFPKNINVSVTLSLAGIGLDRTQVRIIADPRITTNTHHVEVKGRFGQMETTVHNVPFEGNPKTSYLAALSALALLHKLVNPIRTGT